MKNTQIEQARKRRDAERKNNRRLKEMHEHFLFIPEYLPQTQFKARRA